MHPPSHYGLFNYHGHGGPPKDPKSMPEKLRELDEKILHVRHVLQRESLSAAGKSEQDRGSMVHRIKDMESMLKHLET